MTQAIVRVLGEEDRALARALLELDVRRQRVATLQADLARLTLILDRFAAECHLRFASLFAELDHLKRAIAMTERRIMRLRGQTRPPRPPQAEPDADERDGETGQEAGGHRFRRRAGQEAPSEADAESAAELRRLYLELARRYHPDLAKSEDEQAQRQEMMRRINAAFRERDLETLRRIASEAEAADGPRRHTTAARLLWIRREICRLDGLVADLRAELANLRQSDSGRLCARREEGEPVFDLMADDLRGEVARQRLRLNDLTALHDRLMRAGRATRRRAAARTA